MIKPLKKAIDAVSNLPEEDQELAAEMLQLIAARNNSPYVMDEGERQSVERALAEVDRGEFASEEAVRAVLDRKWR